MKPLPPLCSRLLVSVFALTAITISIANGQDPSIDRLLKKLPPPEKLVKPTVEKAIRKSDASVTDPLVPQIFGALDSNNFGRALELCRKLTAAHSNNAAAHCLQGLVAILANQFAEAGRSLRQSEKLNPSLGGTQLGLAALAAFQQHYAAAIPPLKKLTQLEPTYLFGWLYLSDCCLRVGRNAEAAQYARKATTLAPASADAWMQLARGERAVGNMDAALGALTHGAEISPDSADIMATIGYAYINLNRIGQAIAPLQRAARLAPRDYLIHAQLGFCLQATGQVDAGIQHLRTATNLAPKNYAAVWEHLGLAYQKKGMHREAVKAFERATQISPGFTLGWRHLADEYRALGQPAEADRAAAHARSAPSSKKIKG